MTHYSLGILICIKSFFEIIKYSFRIMDYFVHKLYFSKSKHLPDLDLYKVNF